jgi:RNA polymerase sigma-70 factor, ECF subfamily
MDASTTIRLPLLETKKGNGSERMAEAGTGASLQADASDEILMQQVAQDDREALGILFRRYARAVRSVAYRAVRDASEADDLVQEIFLLVNRDAKAFDHSKGLARAWILRIAHRRSISRRRYLSSRHFYNRVDLDDMAGELGDPRASIGQAGNPIEESFGEEDFQRVFEGLSPNQRGTLQLHFFEGDSLAEIAAKLGQSRGNVKHHYFRGLERLRKHLVSTKSRERSQKDRHNPCA